MRGRASDTRFRLRARLSCRRLSVDASLREVDAGRVTDSGTPGGTMTQTISSDATALRAAMKGEVVTPADAGYDDARRLWNADIDRHPAVVAMCADTADVAAAVAFAAERGLEIAVRGGGHSVSGASSVDGGLMINLANLNHVSIDADARRGRAGGGALLGDLIGAAQEHGLAVPVGAVGHTGVGGLTLGGGMGWLTRKHGLSIDNLVRVEIVTADGKALRASADENPDLYWAVRGGGGNFGVITEFEFELHEVGPMIHFGLVFWDLDQGKDVLRTARDVVGSLPPGVNIVIAGLNAPPAPFVPEEHQLKPGYAMLIAGFDSEEEHAGVVAQFRDAVPPLFEFVSPMPYMALQTLLDEANAWGQWYHEKGDYLTDLTDDAIDTITEHLPREQSPMSVVLMYRLDGAYSEIPDDATSFSGGRSPRYGFFIVAVCPVPDLIEPERAWARAFYDALVPDGLDGTYVNALSDDVSESRVRRAYGEAKYARLARIKADYDPANLFHRNANIKPAPA